MRRFLIITCSLVLIGAACSSDDGDEGASPAAGATGGGGPVQITLQEFAIATVPATAAAGSVSFDIENKGPDDAHEFVVFRTDLAPTELPTLANGSVDEEGEGLELIDEVEEIEPGDSGNLTVDLDAGAYVFICNIYDKKEHEAHYEEGMRTAFTVS
jgi:uncharacterized cupredoxin-like copper-binding protein